MTIPVEYYTAHMTKSEMIERISSFEEERDWLKKEIKEIGLPLKGGLAMQRRYQLILVELRILKKAVKCTE